MKKLLIASAAVTALCATATSFASPAEAGFRGGFRFNPFFRPHFHVAPPIYSAPVEERTYRRHKSVRSKPQPKAPLVKFADGTGRQFDPSSKVWFDGKSQCWLGRQPFTFKSGEWFYGKSRWTESNGAWTSSSDAQPELVSCESVPAFAAKAKAFAAKSTPATTKAANETKSSAPARIKTAETDASADTKATAPAAKAECKRYFASIGQMLTVPCNE
jgi:hypothetical protein